MFCAPGEQCIGGGHKDWNEATEKGTYTGRVVTFLRDPVERTLSEFFWLRDSDGQTGAGQIQWDFRNKTWLKGLLVDNITQALETYIRGYPKNPSRNRQALYLLGFRKFPALGPQDQLSVVPGATYDWDREPDELARRALARLDGLTAFGILECWAPSLRAIAGRLGWSARKVLDYAGDLHERNWRSAMVVLGKRRDERARGVQDVTRLIRWLGRDVTPNGTWSSFIPPRYLEEIRRWNNVDVPLYAAARRRFAERFGEACP